MTLKNATRGIPNCMPKTPLPYHTRRRVRHCFRRGPATLGERGRLPRAEISARHPSSCMVPMIFRVFKRAFGKTGLGSRVVGSTLEGAGRSFRNVATGSNSSGPSFGGLRTGVGVAFGLTRGKPSKRTAANVLCRHLRDKFKGCCTPQVTLCT